MRAKTSVSMEVSETERQRELLAGFAEGHQVLYLVAQGLYGREVKDGFRVVVTISGRDKENAVRRANQLIEQGLLVQYFDSQQGQAANLIDSLALTNDGREVLGLPILIAPVVVKERVGVGQLELF